MMHADQPSERRTGTRDLIERLLGERERMLLLYEQSAGVVPAPAGEDYPQLLRRFAELLMDYIAAGHFSLYERIREGAERRRGVHDLAEGLYPRIVATSDAMVAFNDGLTEVTGEEPSDALLAKLSVLGEQIAERVDLEDRLIAEMLGPRK